MEGFPVQAHFLQGFCSGVGDEDVSVGKQLVHDLETLFVLEVQANAALVHVGNVERQIFLVGRGHTVHDSLIHTGGVALGGFNLDDVGSPFAQNSTRCGRGEEGREVDYLDSFERLACLLASFVSSFCWLVSLT